MSGVAHVYRWEIAKLLAQKRTYLGLGAAMLVPIVFVVVLAAPDGRPERRPARPHTSATPGSQCRSSSSSSCRSGACR